MINSTLLIGLLLYFLTIKFTASTHTKPLTASLFVVLTYFAISTFIRSIILTGYDAPLWQLFGFVPIATLVLQFCFAYLGFYKMNQNDHSYMSWLLWGVVGCFGIFIAAPFIVVNLFGPF